MKYFKKRGFTLIEMLVVVLIIGILGAIALPQYQRAVLKSRFAALMPIAKSMANSNEAYYLEHGIYADDPQDLLIQGQSRYTDDTELEFGTVSDYAYVLAKNEDKIPNNTFIVYQKHSGEFPGEIHCEALANNDLAESVCKSFGGNESIGKTLTDGYETYVLFGTGNGVAPTADEGGEGGDEPGENTEPAQPVATPPVTPASLGLTPSSTSPSCTTSGGTETCTYTYEGGQSMTFYDFPNHSVYIGCDNDYNCSTSTTGGDGFYRSSFSSRSIYFDKDGNIVGGEIAPSGYVRYTFDANGNINLQNPYNNVAVQGYSSATYDANGNLRKLREISTNYYYYYDENGVFVKATNSNGQVISTTPAITDVSNYKLSAEVVAEAAAVGAGYKGKNMCDLYPEIKNCPLN